MQAKLSAKDMLIHKLKIYSQGLKKRNRSKEFISIEKKIEDWLII